MSKAKPGLDPVVESKLIKAIESRDSKAVERLVATGIDVNVLLKGAHNETPLNLATRYGANDVAVVLFKAGADWREGGLNLVWSVYFKDEWLTRKLIEVGADPNFKGRTMGRPLPLATSYNLPSLMRLLIDAGADVNADSPLKAAVSANYKEAALMLLQAGALPAKDQELLPWAAHRKNRDVVVALVKAGADLNEQATLSEFDPKRDKHVTYCNNATALMIAAESGAEEIVRDLIEAGADLFAKDATGAMAVDLARKKSHDTVVSLLESEAIRRPRKADPSGDLIFASEKGDTVLVKELLAAGAAVNALDTRPKSKGLTPLMLAARSGHAETVAALLDAGADAALRDDADPGEEMGFNFIFNEGGIEQAMEAGFSMFRTALHCAVEKGNSDVVTLLIRRGADVKGPDRAKLTPLHIAAEKGFGTIVRALLNAGADPDARARGKQTPLHFACGQRNLETVRALVQAGAKVELKNDDGNTPLMIAAARAQPEVLSALLEAGANVHASNRNLRTAIAKVCGSQLYEHKYKGKKVVVEFLRPHSEIIQTIRLLLAAGADPTVKDKEGSSALDEANRGLKHSKFYAEVIALLKTAQPSNLGVAVTKRQSKPKPSPGKGDKVLPEAGTERVREKTSPQPDFSTAAGRPEFQAVLKELESLCGTTPQPMGEVKGGFTVHVQSGKQVNLEKTQREFLEQGCYVFSPDTTFDNRFAILPTTDKYQVLLAMQTNGQNYDLMPEDVVAWLRVLEKDQPFLLTSAGFDFVGGRFITKISRPAELAKRMYEFCPDIVDQGCGDSNALAAELRKSQAFFFWWD